MIYLLVGDGNIDRFFELMHGEYDERRNGVSFFVEKNFYQFDGDGDRLFVVNMSFEEMRRLKKELVGPWETSLYMLGIKRLPLGLSFFEINEQCQNEQ